MGNLVQGIVIIIFGLCFAIFHKVMGQKTAEFWYKIIPMRSSMKAYQISFLIGGIISIILGLLAIL